MSLFISSLNSGSNGNCYYLGNRKDAILVDAGISKREIEKRLKRQDISPASLRGIFISHEHGDHIHGAAAFSKKFKLPVYISSETLHSVQFPIEPELIRIFTESEPVLIGELKVTAFRKKHDAIDPHSFVVESNGVRVGVFTDLGVACENVKHYFRQCHAVFLESNYDEEMLELGRYPYPLKNRIRGGYGHLSNTQALRLFREHKPSFMSHLFLSHLSHQNNRPELVESMFDKFRGKTNVVIASRERETGVYFIDGTFSDLRHSPFSKTEAKKNQLTLF